MTDIVKGMVKARHDAYWSSTAGAGVTMEEEAMRAALLFLADNVSDEMLAAHAAADKGVTTADFRAGFAAAIRAAAGEKSK